MCKNSSEPFRESCFFTLHHRQGLISHSPLEPSGDVPYQGQLCREADSRHPPGVLQRPSQRAARPPGLAERGAGEPRWRDGVLELPEGDWYCRVERAGHQAPRVLRGPRCCAKAL